MFAFAHFPDKFALIECNVTGGMRNMRFKGGNKHFARREAFKLTTFCRILKL